jgi:hypothetical protein
LVRDRGDDAKWAAIGEELAPRRKTLDPVTPEVDQDLTLEALCFDDAPDFERGALVGAHD